LAARWRAVDMDESFRGGAWFKGPMLFRPHGRFWQGAELTLTGRMCLIG